MFRTTDFIDAFESALKVKNYIYLEPMNKSGGWAEIFYVYSREEKKVRVTKVYKEPIGRINENIYKSDAKKLMKIDHENVVKIIDKGIIEYEANNYFFLILEDIKGKNFDEIDSRLFLEKPYNERLSYFNQTLDGINEFRENFDLHRDLHPGNIMISDEDKHKVRTIKIIDPGSSRYYYEPEDEDIDLYTIKEGIINLFLTPEEIKKINENIELKTLEFPEFRELIKKLNIEEKRKLEFDLQDSVIDNNQVDLIVEQLYEERDNIENEISSQDSARKHILFSFSEIPIKIIPDGFDFNDEDTITIIKNLRNNVMYRNPYGGMSAFDDFIKEFTFQGDWYQADYLHNSDNIFNFSRVKIHKSGLISIIIALDASPVEVLQGEHLIFRRDEKFLNSLWINTKLLAYLIMMWLKLTRTIFSKLECHGIVKLILNIYSGWDLSLVGDRKILLGNNINPKSEVDVKISELKDNDEILKIIQLILKELLRYFNIDIDKFQEGYRNFSETIERYFNPVFGDNPK